MMLINTNKIFEDAIKEKKVDVAENLLQCSDSKCELMRNYSQSNCIENLLCMLCEFRSKGLVQNIETICTQHKNFTDCYIGTNTYKNEKKVYEHKANKKSNEIKHLSSSSFKNKREEEIPGLEIKISDSIINSQEYASKIPTANHMICS